MTYTHDPLAEIRERAETDWVTDPENVAPDMGKDLMQARLDRQHLLQEIDLNNDTAASHLAEIARAERLLQYTRSEVERLTAALAARDYE